MKKLFFPKTLFQKLIYTVIIMTIYLVGREIPLYGIDLAGYDAFRDTADDLIMQTIGGDRYRTSVMALGISPYMFSVLFVQMVVSVKNSDRKAHTSPKKITKATLILMVIWSAVQAYFTANSALYIFTNPRELLFAKIIASFQLIAGAFLILYLATRNGKYGIGGQTALIYVNILDSVVNTVRYSKADEFKIIGIISVIAILITIIFENTEYRIPMQRISIHSIYSDKNYIPIKFNPIGMMPVMFSSAFFMLPTYLFLSLSNAFPKNKDLQWISDNMNTTHPLGVNVYIVILYIITVVFSFVFVSPKTLAESLQKSGDSISGLRSGKKTRRFIGVRLFIISLISATFMAIFLGLPLYLHINGYISSSVMSLPSIMIALASINCNLYREFRAVKDYDAYIPFL